MKQKFLRVIMVSLFFLSDAALFSSSAQAIMWEKKAEFFSRAYQEAEEDNAYEDAQAYDSRLRMENKVGFAEDLVMILNADVRYENFQWGRTDDDFDIVLREAFLGVRKENYSFSVGRQIVTWGKLDNVVIVDQVSPQSYRWFVLYDKEERKEPELMVKYNYYADTFELEAIYLPFFEPSQVSYFGPGWSTFGRLQQAVADSTAYTASQKNTVSQIRIEETEDLSNKRIKDSEGGIRLRTKMSDVDVSFYYFNFHNRMPTLQEATANGNVVKAFLFVPTDAMLATLDALNPTAEDSTLYKKHDRLNMVGFDFETVVKQCGVRGEVGLFFDMPYLQSDFAYTRKNTAMAGIGIDYTASNNAYMNLQFVETIIMDYEPLFSQEQYSHEITLELTKHFFRGKVLCSIEGDYRISYSDWMLNPEIRYIFNNGFEAAFGRFAERDIVYLECKLPF